MEGGIGKVKGGEGGGDSGGDVEVKKTGNGRMSEGVL